LGVGESDEGVISGVVTSDNFRGRKFFKWGRVVTSQFLVCYCFNYLELNCLIDVFELLG